MEAASSSDSGTGKKKILESMGGGGGRCTNIGPVLRAGPMIRNVGMT